MREIKLIEALKLIKKYETVEVKSMHSGSCYSDIVNTEQLKLDTHGAIYDFKDKWTVIELDYVGKIMAEGNKIYFMERHSKCSYIYLINMTKGEN